MFSFDKFYLVLRVVLMEDGLGDVSFENRVNALLYNSSFLAILYVHDDNHTKLLVRICRYGLSEQPYYGCVVTSIIGCIVCQQ